MAVFHGDDDLWFEDVVMVGSAMAISEWEEEIVPKRRWPWSKKENVVMKYHVRKPTFGFSRALDES